MTTGNLVTSSSNPDLYARLLATWEEEKRPGWVILSGTTYQVLQAPTGERIFLPNSNESMYNSVGL